MPSPSDDNEAGGWPEWSKFVLHELERLTREVERTNDKLAALMRDLTVLQVKASLWGGLAGVIGGLLGVIVALAMRGQ